MNKKYIIIILSILLLLFVSACSNGIKENSPPESITVTKTSLVLGIGETESIEAIIYPADSESREITWKTENIGIASVENGKITGISEGVTTVIAICAEYPEVYARCAVKITGSSNSYSSSDYKVNPDFLLPEIAARPTDNSIIINVVPAQKSDVFVEYGTSSGKYTEKTNLYTIDGGEVFEIKLEKLLSNTRYFYSICYKESGSADDFIADSENSFVTQRKPGSTFSFGIQGDSHPERPQQFDADLYITTMKNINRYAPDFYITMGDDFSIEKLATINKSGIEEIYKNQRKYLGIVGRNSPLFLVNGNHEHAAQYLLDGTPDNGAVLGQNARNLYFSQPAPDSFYSGDQDEVEYIGKLRDYSAWTWGDALFVIIDPYWHSDVPVDGALGSSTTKNTDLWQITLGENQYQWFRKTLEESKAKYKFVFTHHVLGTGRGGIEEAGMYEWGGYDKNGNSQFGVKRPDWELPIHQLMAKNRVTIFFQGHDHIFAKQELDGVIYQTLPEPADPFYALYFDSSYNAEIKMANTGHVKVTVADNGVKVEYIKSYLPKDETTEHKNGEIGYSYTVIPK